jgi:hypothetical protein
MGFIDISIWHFPVNYSRNGQKIVSWVFFNDLKILILKINWNNLNYNIVPTAIIKWALQRLNSLSWLK